MPPRRCRPTSAHSLGSPQHKVTTDQSTAKTAARTCSSERKLYKVAETWPDTLAENPDLSPKVGPQFGPTLYSFRYGATRQSQPARPKSLVKPKTWDRIDVWLVSRGESREAGIATAVDRVHNSNFYVSHRVAERVWLPLEGHGPPEETKLSRYSQPFLKRCIVIPSKPSFV
jgi:hypothetical protein